MSTKLIVFTLLLGGSTPMLAVSGSLLGVDYSERIGAGLGNDFRVVQAATDKTGALYVLGNSGQLSYVMNLSPAGDNIVWRVTLAYPAGGMAVDANGNVYVIPQSTAPGQAFVEKLNANLAGMPVHFDIGAGLAVTAVTVDSAGRAWVTGYTQPRTDRYKACDCGHIASLPTFVLVRAPRRPSSRDSGASMECYGRKAE